MGPKFGKHVKNIVMALSTLNGNNIVEKIHAGKDYYLDIDGRSFKLTEEDLIISIKDREGYVFESSNGIYVALDTNLTPELIKEGFARELVNKIQYTRKENQFDIMDKIKIFYSAEAEIKQVFEDFADYIKSETLAEVIYFVKIPEKDMTEWDINGKVVHISIAHNVI